MRQYLNLLKEVLNHGDAKTDPQGIGNLAIFSYQLRIDMNQGHFPLLTTKKLPFKSIAYELLWFLRGETRVKFLQDHGVTIWDEWATPEMCAMFGREPGDLGPIYGYQWRHWPKRKEFPLELIESVESSETSYEKFPSLQNASILIESFEKLFHIIKKPPKEIDQIANLVNDLKTNPDTRRLIVASWNPEDANNVFVAPCHCFFECFHAKGELSLHLTQRSADVFLGVPFNIASYALLLLMLAQITNLKPKELVLDLVDAHLYLNAVEQAKLQLTRKPRPLPNLWVNPEIDDIFKFKYEDFRLDGYNPYPHIKAEVGI